MPKIVQIRRGTSAQNNDFTGAIGEITMDTTNKTLRVHDGETAGGTALAKQSTLDGADYVVESQFPTAANNYTWYRKYKSGWVEQGGYISEISTVSISIPIPLSTICSFSRGVSHLSGTLTASHNTISAAFGRVTTTTVSITGGGYWFLYGVCAMS